MVIPDVQSLRHRYPLQDDMPTNNNNKRLNRQPAKVVVETQVSRQAKNTGANAQRRITRKKGSNSAQKRPLPQYVIARTNPFSPEAFGVKAPDDNLAYSTTFHTSGEIALGGNTNGYANYAFTADPNLAFVSGNSTTGIGWGADYSTNVTLVPNVSAIQSSVEVLRTVTFGVRIQCLLSPNNAQGRVHACLAAIDYTRAGFNGSLPSPISAMKDMPGYCSVELADLIGDSFYVIGKPTDNGWTRYRSSLQRWASAATQMEATIGWYGIILAFDGLPTTGNSVRLEYIYHFEGIPNAPGSVVEATPPAPYQPLLMAAEENLMSMVPAARVQKEDNHIDWVDKIEKAWNTAVTFATTVSGYVSTAARLASIFI